MEDKIKKLDITSTAVEKGLDAAKSFLDKLISPAIEEVGLLIASPIKMWRLKREIKMLYRAKEICEKNKINIKQVNLKLLVPLLEHSSIEEDDEMLDKWSIMLSNLADSEQNIENHVLPYLLSQISKQEFLLIEKAYDERQQVDKLFKEKVKELKRILPSFNYDEWFDTEFLKSLYQIQTGLYNKELNTQEKAIQLLTESIIELYGKWKGYIEIDYSEPTELQITNLLRLGILRTDREYETRLNKYKDQIYKVDLDWKEALLLTELGNQFLRACKLKS